MNTRHLLLEIGCEELPSSGLKALGLGFYEQVLKALDSRSLGHGPGTWFATPRRLAVLIDDVVEQGEDEQNEALGPPLAQARDEQGAWAKAAIGFAQRHGVTPDQLVSVETPKGTRLAYRSVSKGLKTREVVNELFAQAITGIPVAKRMRWGASRLEFARPIQWLTLVYGEESEFGDVVGVASGRTTFGHRFHAPGPIELKNAADYSDMLKQAYVIADFDDRASLIKKQVTAQAEKLGAKARIDESLLEEVASLVEWPSALAGSFDEAFLKVPSEALISSMQSHQKYFPVLDERGELKPHFITVSNIESLDPAQVIAGNEKVIRPRLADAAFFFEQDLRQKLEDRVLRLDGVIFQKKLGSLGDKTRRVQRLAAAIAKLLRANEAVATRAATLCKADLVSDLVLEFGDLQGVAGAYYARNDQEPAGVADAIQQHYWPLQSGSKLPESLEAISVALADRLDTLVGIFAIGLIPSGSKDPFALRRASIAVLRILVERDLKLDLTELLRLSSKTYPDGLVSSEALDSVQSYALDRFPALFEDQAIAVEVFRAVRNTGCTEPADFAARINAVREFQNREESQVLAAANKRVSNILSKAVAGEVAETIDATLLTELAEKQLFDAIQVATDRGKDALASKRYTEVMTGLASLKTPVDEFFDDVMVNAEDPKIKANRLALLSQLREQFQTVADISQLAG
ncbi:MAG: glycine--tRNA ligase subunit beta [Pseudomonadota bacterium]